VTSAIGPETTEKPAEKPADAAAPAEGEESDVDAGDRNSELYKKLLEEVKTTAPKGKLEAAFKAIKLNATYLELETVPTNGKNQFLYKFTLYYGAAAANPDLAAKASTPEGRKELGAKVLMLANQIEKEEVARRAYMDWFKEVMTGNADMKKDYDAALAKYTIEVAAEKKKNEAEKKKVAEGTKTTPPPASAVKVEIAAGKPNVVDASGKKTDSKTDKPADAKDKPAGAKKEKTEEEKKEKAAKKAAKPAP